jgi:hypothetical protein
MRLLVAVATLLAVAFSAPASSTTCTQTIARCKQAGATKPNIDIAASVFQREERITSPALES